MATILPKSEKLRQAIKWISNKRQQGDKYKEIVKLISDASLTFDLSPQEEDFLTCFYNDKKI